MPLKPTNGLQFRSEFGAFSISITVICTTLAALMFWASHWQWTKYLYKKKLLETYASHNSDEGEINFSPRIPKEHFFKKVRVRGTWDYEKQVVLINRKNYSGPGYLLLTPFIPEDGSKAVIISRGFIPWKDRKPQSWKQYSHDRESVVEISGIIKPSIKKRTMFSPTNPLTGEGLKFQYYFKFPDIGAISKQLPYPTRTDVFLERLGPPSKGLYPEEFVRLQVPPQTHFGYTFEWIFLAIATLTLGFVIQRYPRIFRRKKARIIENALKNAKK